MELAECRIISCILHVVDNLVTSRIRLYGKSVFNLECISGWIIVDLYDFLDDCVLVDWRSAQRAKQTRSILFKVLNKVVVAFFVELMRIVAFELNDLVFVGHLLVAEDALSSLRAGQSLVDCALEAVS